MFHVLFVVLLAALTAGCATSPQLVELQNFDQQKITVQKAVDPIAFIGLPTSGKWEQYYHTGQVFGVVVEFPRGDKEEGLESEFDFLLSGYDAQAFRQDGREFLARSLFIGNKDCKLSMLLIVGGTNNPAGMKGMVASTLSDRMYRLRNEPGVAVRIAEFQPENQESYEARRSFVLRYGTSLEGFEYVSSQKLRELFSDWKQFKGAKHIESFLAPPWLTYDAVNSVATLNPRYTFSEKFAGTASLTFLPLSPVIGTLGGLGLDAIGAARAPSRGRDSKSIPGERAEASKRILDALKSQCSPQNLTRR